MNKYNGFLDNSEMSCKRIIEKHFPNSSELVLKKLSITHASIVYLIADKQKKNIYALKLLAYENAASIIKTAFDCWASAGVPCLNIIAYGYETEAEYIITEFIHGLDANNLLIDSPERITLAREMGKSLALMSHCEIEGYGEFLNEKQGSFNSFYKFVIHQYHPAINHLYNKSFSIDQSIHNRLMNMIKRLQSLDIKGSILHQDYYVHNVFVSETTHQFLALSDPQPIIGDSLLDIANYKYFNFSAKMRDIGVYMNNTSRHSELMLAYNKEVDEFIKGYEAQRGKELSHDEKQRILIYEILIVCQKIFRYLIHKALIYNISHNTNHLKNLLDQLD